MENADRRPELLQSTKSQNVIRNLMFRDFGFHITDKTGTRELELLAERHLIKKNHKELVCDLPGIPRSTFMMTFSPDGTKMASIHGNHNIYITEIATGKNIEILSGHPRTPWCIAFHPSSSQILASGCLGGQVRVWNLNGGSKVWNSKDTNCISSLAFHPTAELLVIALCNEIHFWDWNESKPFAVITTKTEKEKVRYVAFDNLGEKLITGIDNIHYHENIQELSSNMKRAADASKPRQCRRHSKYFIPCNRTFIQNDEAIFKLRTAENAQINNSKSNDESIDKTNSNSNAETNKTVSKFNINNELINNKLLDNKRSIENSVRNTERTILNHSSLGQLETKSDEKNVISETSSNQSPVCEEVLRVCQQIELLNRCIDIAWWTRESLRQIRPSNEFTSKEKKINDERTTELNINDSNISLKSISSIPSNSRSETVRNSKTLLETYKKEDSNIDKKIDTLCQPSTSKGFTDLNSETCQSKRRVLLSRWFDFVNNSRLESGEGRGNNDNNELNIIQKRSISNHRSYRVQAWDYSTGEMPDITNSEKNIVVPECHIFNDGSIDISSDGKFLAAYFSTSLGIYSLEWETLGKRICSTERCKPSLSVSISPTQRHLLVGLPGSIQIYELINEEFQSDWNPYSILWHFTLRDLDTTDLHMEHLSKKDSMVVVRELLQIDQEILRHKTINCTRWAPQPGQGLVYATNTGQLNILY